MPRSWHSRMSTAGKSNVRYSGTTAGAKRSLGQKRPAEVFTSIMTVLTCAFASLSTKAATEASVVPASRGWDQTARPFSVGTAGAGAAAAAADGAAASAAARAAKSAVRASFPAFMAAPPVSVKPAGL